MGFLRRFMYGRYGSDQLNLFLLGAYLLLYLLSCITGLSILGTIGFVCILFGLWRMLSRRFDKRRAENEKFLRLIRPLSGWISLRRNMYRDKAHCYFRCPNCSQHLRVPRGKGKITITCRSCGTSFQKKS